MLKRLLVAVLLGATPALAAPPVPLETYAAPARLVSLPDGRRMNLFCLGHGAPTVVLDAGWSSGMSAWAPIHATLAETTQVCAFDRAGVGFSDVGPLPRDTRAIVADERAMLKAGGLAGPYVLVGHSMAGLDVRLYASLYPKEVAGVVLVDPSNPHQDARFAVVAPTAAAASSAQTEALRTCVDRVASGALKRGDAGFETCFAPPPATLPEPLRAVLIARQGDVGRLRSQLSEVDAMGGADSDQIDAHLRKLGDLPLIVLTASGRPPMPGMPPAEAEAAARVWSQMHDEAAALSTRGENRTVEAQHRIWADKPEAVVDAVNEVVATARARR